MSRWRVWPGQRSRIIQCNPFQHISKQFFGRNYPSLYRWVLGLIKSTLLASPGCCKPFKSDFRNHGHLIINIKTTITSVNDLKYQSVIRADYSQFIFKKPGGNRNSAVTNLLLLKEFFRQLRDCSPLAVSKSSWGCVRVKYASVTQYKIEILSKRNTMQCWDCEAWPQEGKAGVSPGWAHSDPACRQKWFRFWVTRQHKTWGGCTVSSSREKRQIWYFQLNLQHHFSTVNCSQQVDTCMSNSWITSFAIFTPALPSAQY